MLFTIAGAGTLFVCGIAFALFLGIASSRIETERERELHEQEQHSTAE